MKRSLCSLVILVSLAAGPCLADDAAQTTAPPKKGGFDPNQVICKQVAVTDSHLPGQRVCATWAQWEQQTQQDQKTLGDAALRPAPTAGGFGPGGAGNAGGMRR